MPGYGKGKCAMNGLGQQHGGGRCMSVATENAKNDKLPLNMTEEGGHGRMPRGGSRGHCFGGYGHFGTSGIADITDATSLKRHLERIDETRKQIEERLSEIEGKEVKSD